MHRKTDTYELDYPKDDIESWERYPKHRWVYELSRLLDSQNIKWSPYDVSSLQGRELNIELVSINPIIRQPGYIYVRKSDGDHIITETHIIRGEIKNIRHFDSVTNNELDSLIGEVELRISAFVTLHFQKFTGVLSIDTYGHDIFRIRLRPHVDPASEANADVLKLIKRIYKKSDVIVSGPSDRILHESLAS